MNVDRSTGRWIIALVVVAGFAWVASALYGSHYYRLTYSVCSRLETNPYCEEWQHVAIARCILVLALGAGAFLYNERRKNQ
jgi:hypothetical protein